MIGKRQEMYDKRTKGQADGKQDSTPTSSWHLPEILSSPFLLPFTGKIADLLIDNKIGLTTTSFQVQCRKTK